MTRNPPRRSVNPPVGGNEGKAKTQSKPSENAPAEGRNTTNNKRVAAGEIAKVEAIGPFGMILQATTGDGSIFVSVDGGKSYFDTDRTTPIGLIKSGPTPEGGPAATPKPPVQEGPGQLKPPEDDSGNAGTSRGR